MKKLLLFTLIITIQHAFSQKHCIDKNAKGIVDVNELSIDKCTVDERQRLVNPLKESLVVHKRYLKKRRLNVQTLFTSNELNRDITSTEIKPIKHQIIKVALSLKNTEVISFIDVDIPPFFPLVDNQDYEKEVSFNFLMKKHIEENFRYPQRAVKERIEGEVIVNFIIDEEGIIRSINTYSEENHTVLKEEAIRIVSLLPKFTPGKHQGKPVKVSYTFPMSFFLN